MKAFKQYGWALKIIGAALLIALALVLCFGDGEGIVVPFVGGAIIIYSAVRLVPFVKTQKNDLIKTINIIEITIDIIIGLVFIVIVGFTDIDLGKVFGYLLGLFFMVRGAVHFYGISVGAEKSDLPLYLFHIGALIIGSFIFFFDGGFTAATLILVILIFSGVAGGYLSYDGFKGYRVYRYQKTLSMPAVKNVEDTIVDQPVPVIEEEEPVQDQVVS